MKVNHRIAYSQEFDQLYGYAGEDLGATYTREQTVFRLWSPLADSVTLRLYRSGTAEVSWQAPEKIITVLFEGEFMSPTVSVSVSTEKRQPEILKFTDPVP